MANDQKITLHIDGDISDVRKKLEQLKQEKMLQMQKHLNKLLRELQLAKKMIYQILELNLIKMEK